MSLISDFVCAECEAEFKTVLGGDSMWVLREKAGDGSETLNVNGFVAETKSTVVLCFLLGFWALSLYEGKYFVLSVVGLGLGFHIIL
ncbi:hypothetical protein NC652_041572 [Populus alba x Populus x berolinensis]|nr:hypothetical protein NC652_041554 [Populus alba x Populus x berolinensis]KAJ6859321.1 hypothetical protein NC652_041572 [Populus alba x Populus x berolinensis]